MRPASGDRPARQHPGHAASASDSTHRVEPAFFDAGLLRRRGHSATAIRLAADVGTSHRHRRRLADVADPAASARRAAPDRRAGRGAALGDRRAPRRDRAGAAPLRVAPPRGARARVPRRARPAGPVRRARVRPARADPRRARPRPKRRASRASAPSCDRCGTVVDRGRSDTEDMPLHDAALHARRGSAVPRRADVDVRHLGEGLRPPPARTAAGARRSPIVTSVERPRNFPSIPFVGLAEGMVLAAFRRAGVSLQHIRKAVDVLERRDRHRARAGFATAAVCGARTAESR